MGLLVMVKSDIEYFDLRNDGNIVMYLGSTKNPNYQIRLKLPNTKKYIRKSTQTTNFEVGKRFGLELYEELNFRIRSGEKIDSPTYQKVFEEWKKYKISVGITNKGNSWNKEIKNVEDYSVNYFKNRRIDTIKTEDFSRFWEWRKVNYKRVIPKNSSLNRERVSILGLMNFCVERGYILKLPKIPKSTTDSFERKPTFTDSEYKKISRNLREWVKEGVKKGKWRDRYIFQQYFLILSNSGMRIGELRNLKWEDIRVKKDNSDPLIVKVKGKSGSREVVFNKGSDLYVQRMYDLRKNHLNRTPNLDEPIFINYSTNKPLISLKNGFFSILKYCNIPIKKGGMNRSLYSLRSFYITKRLEEDVSIHLLSRNVGSGVDMIEKYYSHIITSSLSKQLTKTTQNITQQKPTQPYFWITHTKPKQITHKK